MSGVERLLTSMKRATRVLRGSGVPFVLCGGLAVYARGGTAPDHDVDFLIKETDRERALDAFALAEFGICRPPEDWLVKAFDGEILIDLIYRPVDRPVSDATLTDAEEIAVGAAKVPVLSGTELLVHSLLTLSPHECNMTASLALARAIREQIDFDRVAEQTAPSPFARAFLYLVDELDLLGKGRA